MRRRHVRLEPARRVAQGVQILDDRAAARAAGEVRLERVEARDVERLLGRLQRPVHVFAQRRFVLVTVHALNIRVPRAARRSR